MTKRELAHFKQHVHINMRTHCHEWTGALSRDGYGRVKQGGKCKQTHRVAFEHFYKRPIKLGLEIDHLCNNESCCNPNHLEEVTHEENMLRKHLRAIGELVFIVLI